MRKDAQETIMNLSDNDIWLFQHMITAFWHTFGIANGLDIRKEDIEEVRYRKGTPRVTYRVKAEVMQAKLAEYLRWLESYKENWNSERFSCDALVRKEVYEPYHISRQAITQMIELLQV